MDAALRSICDDVERRGFARVVLVTADSDHGNTEAFHPAARTLNKRTLGQALNALRTGAATVEQVRQWRQRLELASELAAGDLARLSGFVAEHVQTNYTALPNTEGTVTGVTAAEVRTATAVDIFQRWAM